MKIYLDNNLGVSNVEQEELTQDTIGYNILKVYIPNAVLTPYDTFTCYYGALLQNGRKVGWFAMEARTSTDADYEENYTLYKATLEQCVVSVEGKVYIGCQVLLGNSGNATLIKKNTAVVQFNVRKSVAINNDILIIDPDQSNTDVLESYKQLLENALTTYATKATTYTITQTDALLDQKQDNLTFDSTPTANSTNPVTSGGVKTALDLKADKSTTYTKTEVDSALSLKADKSDTYTKQEVNEAASGIMEYVYALSGKVWDLSDTTIQLENDVENLKSVQNVVEVVPTYSALQSYDTTKLDVNDKVQVIADETHDGASTIYNWDGTQWQYVGAFGGNSYTKAETYNKTQIDSALRDKADKSDTYTRAVIDSMVLTLSTDKADKSNTYTKTEIDNTMQEVGNMFEIVENEVLKKADKTEVDQKINDLRWELGSHTLDVESDTTTAYSKSVPSGAIGCQINQIGGMSYKSENLIVLTDETKTVSSVTFTIQNGKISSSGTPTTTGWIKIKEFTLNAGTYSYADLTTNTSKVYLVTSNYVQLATTFTLSETTTIFIGKTGNDIINNGNVSNSMPMLVSGSTPPTTWSEGFSGIRNTAVSQLTIKDSNNVTKATFTIPSQIQALDGYGWGISESVCNYIDFERKVFVQKVGRVDLGTLTWNYNALGEPSYFYASIANAVNSINVSCSLYESAVVLPTNTEDKIICITQNQVRIRDNELEGSIVDLNTKLNGVYLYYERATPVETDISAYLTTDTIDVEPLGTLEFTNTYSQDVPSDIDYLIEEVKA